ncbi:unnamed protein product [Trifolium pratense]|uniref:Uncharacterized protein n=1 Tax=Trifolium pratense TaxID=57577 RepID=A0ACB0IAC1_TRIPR|nr:unnamed protein product [Trifolium pratense]
MLDDTIVASFLLTLNNKTSSSSSSSTLSPPFNVHWTIRQRRSKPRSHTSKIKIQSRRPSPTTLSWSSSTSASAAATTTDGNEESTRFNKSAHTSRSKGPLAWALIVWRCNLTLQGPLVFSSIFYLENDFIRPRLYSDHQQSPFHVPASGGAYRHDLWNSTNSKLFAACSNAGVNFPKADSKTQPDRYLLIATSGGLNQQRTGIIDAVVAAYILNATLVIPELDHTSFWKDSRYVFTFYFYHIRTSLQSQVLINIFY